MVSILQLIVVAATLAPVVLVTPLPNPQAAGRCAPHHFAGVSPMESGAGSNSYGDVMGAASTSPQGIPQSTTEAASPMTNAAGPVGNSYGDVKGAAATAPQGAAQTIAAPALSGSNVPSTTTSPNAARQPIVVAFSGQPANVAGQPIREPIAYLSSPAQTPAQSPFGASLQPMLGTVMPAAKNNGYVCTLTIAVSVGNATQPAAAPARAPEHPCRFDAQYTGNANVKKEGPVKQTADSIVVPQGARVTQTVPLPKGFTGAELSAHSVIVTVKNVELSAYGVVRFPGSDIEQGFSLITQAPAAGKGGRGFNAQKDTVTYVVDLAPANIGSAKECELEFGSGIHLVSSHVCPKTEALAKVYPEEKTSGAYLPTQSATQVADQAGKDAQSATQVGDQTGKVAPAKDDKPSTTQVQTASQSDAHINVQEDHQVKDTSGAQTNDDTLKNNPTFEDCKTYRDQNLKTTAALKTVDQYLKSCEQLLSEKNEALVTCDAFKQLQGMAAAQVGESEKTMVAVQERLKDILSKIDSKTCPAATTTTGNAAREVEDKLPEACRLTGKDIETTAQNYAKAADENERASLASAIRDKVAKYIQSGTNQCVKAQARVYPKEPMFECSTLGLIRPLLRVDDKSVGIVGAEEKKHCTEQAPLSDSECQQYRVYYNQMAVAGSKVVIKDEYLRNCPAILGKSLFDCGKHTIVSSTMEPPQMVLFNETTKAERENCKAKGLKVGSQVCSQFKENLKAQASKANQVSLQSFKWLSGYTLLFSEFEDQCATNALADNPEDCELVNAVEMILRLAHNGYRGYPNEAVQLASNLRLNVIIPIRESCPLP